MENVYAYKYEVLLECSASYCCLLEGTFWINFNVCMSFEKERKSKRLYVEKQKF